MSTILLKHFCTCVKFIEALSHYIANKPSNVTQSMYKRVRTVLSKYYFDLEGECLGLAEEERDLDNNRSRW